MEEGYYSKRLDDLEKRRIELLTQRKINKMSLDGVNREIEACKEAMNNQTKVVNTHATSKDAYILKLENQLDEAKKSINSLKKDNTQLKHDLQNASHKISELNDEIGDLNQTINALKIDAANSLSSGGGAETSEDMWDGNIFDQIMSGLDEK